MPWAALHAGGFALPARGFSRGFLAPNEPQARLGLLQRCGAMGPWLHGAGRTQAS